MVMGFVICFFLVMGFVLLFFWMEFKDQKKYSQGKNNRILSKDGLRVTYVYDIPHTEAQVIEILGHKNAQDRLVYEFDEKLMEIRFESPQNEFYHRMVSFSARYRMRFEPKEDSCLLYLEQINIFHSEELVGMRMNAFWSVKVDAVPCEAV